MDQLHQNMVAYYAAGLFLLPDLEMCLIFTASLIPSECNMHHIATH